MLGTGWRSAMLISWKSVCWGTWILASTSLRRVKCLTSSLGKAVIASAKCVTPGKMSIGCSAAVPETPSRSRPAPRPVVADDLGGLVLVCRTGCRRLGASDAVAEGFEVFIAIGYVRVCEGIVGGGRGQVEVRRNEHEDDVEGRRVERAPSAGQARIECR